MAYLVVINRKMLMKTRLAKAYEQIQTTKQPFPHYSPTTN